APRPESEAGTVAEAKPRLVDHADDRNLLVVYGDDGAEEGDPVGEAEGAVDRVEDPLERRAGVHRRELFTDYAVIREPIADQGAQRALGREVGVGDVAGVGLEALGEARPHMVPHYRPGAAREAERRLQQSPALGEGDARSGGHGPNVARPSGPEHHTPQPPGGLDTAPNARYPIGSLLTAYPKYTQADTSRTRRISMSSGTPIQDV